MSEWVNGREDSQDSQDLASRPGAIRRKQSHAGLRGSRRGLTSWVPYPIGTMGEDLRRSWNPLQAPCLLKRWRFSSEGLTPKGQTEGRLQELCYGSLWDTSRPPIPSRGPTLVGPGGREGSGNRHCKWPVGSLGGSGWRKWSGPCSSPSAQRGRANRTRDLVISGPRGGGGAGAAAEPREEAGAPRGTGLAQPMRAWIA